MDKTQLDPKDTGKLGTFAGVFTPSILTILGIILFLRLGFVVGQAGLKQTLVILILANGLSVLTSVSLAAIATNIKVKGGGVYYMIARTLGLEFGGAIGIVLFLAQSVSIAFYCIGFAEVVSGMLWPESRFAVQGLAALAVMILFALAWVGADWATRFQYGVMAVLFVALVSFYVGGIMRWDTAVLAENLSAPAENLGFWAIFAIFFPAVTGFTQGVSMSGDLKDPGKSLPVGTFLAVGISIAIYFTAAVLFAGTLPRGILLHDYGAMKQVALVDFLIDAGVVAATLSSAMASFLGAPRILQSLAMDRIFPFLLPFAKGSGPFENPRRAVFLSGVIAIATIGIGSLNLVASVVSMFFLISYGLLNYATYFEARTASPSFRPRFKWYDARLSLAGGLICLGAMLAIDLTAGVVAVAVLFAIYQYLGRTAGPSRWADSRRSYHLQRVRENLLAAAEAPQHARDWRPQILLFAGDGDRRKHLLLFASWVAADSGFVCAVHVLEGEGIKTLRQKTKIESTLGVEIKESGVKAFPLVVAAPDFTQGVHTLFQSFGIGPVKANTILLNWTRKTDSGSRQVFGTNLRNVFRLGGNLIGLDAKESEWAALGSLDPGARRIDVWWWGDATSRLMLLLAYLMTRSESWRDAKIRVLAADYDIESDQTVDDLHRILEEVRIEAEPEVVIRPSADAVAAFSADAALVFTPFRLKGSLPVDPFGGSLDPFLARLPVVALVLAAEDIDLDAEPETGAAGEAAAALDAYADAHKKAGEMEKDAAAASAAADEKIADLMRMIVLKEDLENLAKARSAASHAKEEAVKMARRAARGLAKAEAAVRQMERLGLKPPAAEETQPGDSPQKE